MDMVSVLGEAVYIKTDLTTMRASIHEDNVAAVILKETPPPQYTPQSKHYDIITIWFSAEIVKRGIKLVKIDTVARHGKYIDNID